MSYLIQHLKLFAKTIFLFCKSTIFSWQKRGMHQFMRRASLQKGGSPQSCGLYWGEQQRGSEQECGALHITTEWQALERRREGGGQTTGLPVRLLTVPQLRTAESLSEKGQGWIREEATTAAKQIKNTELGNKNDALAPFPDGGLNNKKDKNYSLGTGD